MSTTDIVRIWVDYLRQVEVGVRLRGKSVEIESPIVGQFGMPPSGTLVGVSPLEILLVVKLR